MYACVVALVRRCISCTFRLLLLLAIAIRSVHDYYGRLMDEVAIDRWLHVYLENRNIRRACIVV